MRLKAASLNWEPHHPAGPTEVTLTLRFMGRPDEVADIGDRLRSLTDCDAWGRVVGGLLKNAEYAEGPEGRIVSFCGSDARGLKITITDGSIDAFKRHAHPVPLEPNVRPALAAFLRELGFEVVQ